MPYTEKDIERFWAKVDKQKSSIFYNGTRCWEWNSSCFSNHYGAFYFDGKARLAHRVSFELTFGKIPDGLDVLHRCDNPSCVNPEHLFHGTQQDNMDDMTTKGRRGNSRPISPAKGEGHGNHKLSDKQVSEIRKRYGFRGVGGETLTALADSFGVSAQTIWDIVKNNRT